MLTQLLIVSLCAGASGPYNKACNKTVEATSITVGATQFEGQLANYANSKGKYLLGEDIWNTTGFIGGVAYKGIKEKSVSYKIKTKSFIGADFVKPQIDYKPNGRGGSLNFGWSW